MAYALRSTDRLFLRYCRTGDPRALGIVFDRTAPELLRIAGWLAGNRIDAEDLLQHTFLVAIEARGSFDPAQRALPWLSGILANQARNLRRQRARRAALATEPGAARDQAAAAMDAEFGAAVTAARLAIGSPYREVLDLHLEHGMNSKEIAAKLGRPAGTVRTQLMRALEILRQRLPNGFVAGLAPLAPDAVALTAVKAAVIAAAKSAGPVVVTTGVATTAMATGGVLVAKKILLVVPALVLLLGVGVYFGWQPSADQQAPPTPATPVIAAIDKDAHAAKDASVTLATPADRQPVAAPSPTDADPGFASLRVQVRWQHDNSPAAGVGVSALLPHCSLRRDGVTAGDGICTLRHLSPAPWRLSCSHANKSDVIDIAADEVRTVELVALRQATVRGTVLDDADRPVADARIWVADGRGPDERQYDVARSDSRGWFVLPVFGRQLFGARKSGHAPSLAPTIDAATGDCEVVLRLRGAAASVRGTVSDPHGKPVAWARVRIGAWDQMSGIGGPFENLTEAYGEQVITGADGVFAFDASRPDQAGIWANAEGFAPHAGSLSLAAGRNNEVDIRLERESVVAGTVRGADGKPVAGVSISVPYGDRARPWLFSSPTARTDAAGHFEMRGLPAGETELMARQQPNETKTKLQLVAGARTEWNPTFGGRYIRGIVLGPDGAPMAGVPIGPRIGDAAHARYRAATDAHGRFTLVVGDEPETVEVGDLQHEPLATIENVAPDTDDLEIRITHADMPTASLRGRLVDEVGNAVAASVGVPAYRGMTRIRAVKTDTTGAFLLGPMRPGPRELEIVTQDRGRVLVDPVELAPDRTNDLGTITVPRPGSATFALFDTDGQLLGNALLYIYGDKAGNRAIGGATVENGRASIAVLPPGRWRVITNQRGLGPAEIEIQSGITTHLELRHR